MSDYQPIACGLHDRMEAAAVRRTPVRIESRSPEGPRVHEGLIQDIVVRNGAEFLLMADSAEIRLDHIDRFVESSEATG